MIRLEQIVDPGTLAGVYAGIGTAYILLDRRIRRVENQLSRLLGEEEARREVKSKN